ncbi:MAG: tRNA uracil 4-sulfurtransferase ThiI [Candidatus Paceibacterota bacterium]|jgi:thiamine biosynthesis protein ThiI|nr:tRNA 4-thiouridine(8) synthase ThiI [Candidatus Paceibacterota bacterium]MDD5621041.1 tRNA 4-thiouridine(8) synthase ThiI [Candidatus Paceibacterota bacterium]
MKNTHILCHYSEIALKGRNRSFFEKKLIENIKKSLDKDSFSTVKLFGGIISFELTPAAKEKKIKESLSKVFGISGFSFAVKTNQDIKDIKKISLEAIKEKKGKTFKIHCSRSDKSFSLTSNKVNNIVGKYICDNTDKIVKLKKPSITCFIEIVKKEAYIYVKKEKGLGGLPVSCAGKVISLISGGIDSPVSSYLIMKRGASCIFVSFHSYPYTDEQSLKKIHNLVRMLTPYQNKSTLYMVPFANIQQEIATNTPSSLRIILYRRMMVRIAQEIAKQEHAQAIISGDSLSQVASQTLENISAIEQAADIPIFRPLIGMNKDEIISIAQRIKTFDISILPHQDCCTRFVPANPATKANLKDVLQAENNLNIKKLIKEALIGYEKIYF